MRRPTKSGAEASSYPDAQLPHFYARGSLIMELSFRSPIIDPRRYTVKTVFPLYRTWAADAPARAGEVRICGLWASEYHTVMQQKLTPSQTAALLDVTTRTLRRWSKAFAGSLSETASRSGKKRFYQGSDVEVLRIAQEELRQGKTVKEVAASLPKAATGSTETALILSPEQNIVLGEVRERTRHLDFVSEDHEDRLKQLEAELVYMRWKSLPFWKRWSAPPPE